MVRLSISASTVSIVKGRDQILEQAGANGKQHL